ncbi:MAG: MiaB/RimO family radical SAM methylthiotransferase [Kiritimatiellae bacterium]|nr:MiaB/RimO family radical SAM methylthiotransferase [Kiritimatiellia bacterium]
MRDSPPLRTYRVRVLGCKVNQYEARQIAQALEARGLTPAAEGAPADLEAVHTCAVTGAAESKTRHLIRRALAESASGMALASGCGAGRIHEKGVLVIPPGPDWARELEHALSALPLPQPPEGRRGVESALGEFRGHTRAFLKIQDGCDAGCRYCIVPSLRGGPRDKPLDALVDEARGLAAAGHREIVVTGVHVGAWGRGGGGLARALEALAGVPGLERIRMSSLHPAELDETLLAVWAAHPAILPHVHLPMQSGSDRVLAAMGRGYLRADFVRAVDRARRALDEPAFSTDIIVGFPGESERDFEDTLGLCREVGFCRIHVFPFSARTGTAAAGLPDRVSAGAIRERVRRLNALGRDLAQSAAEAWMGRNARVLCETRRPGTGMWEGYTERYLPVRLPGPEDWNGRIVEVTLCRAERGVLMGRNPRPDPAV